MEQTKYKLILGSASPRRKELLGASFIKFSIKTADIEEHSAEENPAEFAQDLALQKARKVFSDVQDPKSFVLGADTIVILDNEILGKPVDEDEARQMLTRLSGRGHQVITAVAFVTDKKEYTFFEQTDVFFQEISDDLMQSYLATKDSLDKAGAYGIQGEGLAFIDRVEGSYSNVVGLPIDKVILNLKKFLGYETDNKGQWRECFE